MPQYIKIWRTWLVKSYLTSYNCYLLLTLSRSTFLVFFNATENIVAWTNNCSNWNLNIVKFLIKTFWSKLSSCRVHQFFCHLTLNVKISLFVYEAFVSSSVNANYVSFMKLGPCLLIVFDVSALRTYWILHKLHAVRFTF